MPKNLLPRLRRFALLVALVAVATGRAESLLNLDFGTGSTSQKAGPSAVGQSAGDFWNLYSRDDGAGGFRSSGELANLKWADGSASPIEVSVTNAAGAGGSGASDPMFGTYLYPQPDGNSAIQVTLTQAPAGHYDLLLYGHGFGDTENGVFHVEGYGTDYGTKSIGTAPGWNADYWREGVQYVRFADVVSDGVGGLRIEVKPGTSGRAVLNGLQLIQQAAQAPVVLFTAVTDNSFSDDLGTSPGAAWGDYDHDGRPDLFVTDSSGRDRLYHNEPDGTFRLTSSLLPPTLGTSHGCAWGDFDNDGRLDLLVGKRSGGTSVIYHQRSDGTFELLSEAAFPAAFGDTVGAAWGDFDKDGYLDVFLADLSGKNRLFKNHAGQSFTRVNDTPAAEAKSAVGVAWGDYDNDGNLDLFVANGGNQDNSLFHNVGGALIKVTDSAVCTGGGYSVGAAWGDYDNDGFLDLFVANRLGRNFLYHNNGDGTFSEVKTSVVVNDHGDFNGCAWADYDNDGYLDLFVANFSGPSCYIYHNSGDGTFTRVTTEPPTLAGSSGDAVVLADYDGNGFLDLFLAKWGGGQSQLYRNGGNDHHWLTLRLSGVATNRSAIGARIRLKTTVNDREHWQTREISSGDGWGGASLDAHFGLGASATVDAIQIQWPSGNSQELKGVAADQILTLTEVLPVLKIAPQSGFFSGEVIVAFTVALEGAEVRYTLDGSEPTASSTRYDAPFTLATTARVQARLFKDGAPASDVASVVYLENRWNDGIPAAWRERHWGAEWFAQAAAGPLADPDNDGFTNYQEWLAGTDPLDVNSKPANPITLLTLVPSGGTYEVSTDIQFQTPVPLSTIRYTKDGTDPTPVSEALPADIPGVMQTRIVLTHSSTVKAQLFVNANPVSPIVSENYTIIDIPPRIIQQPVFRTIPYKPFVMEGDFLKFSLKVAGSQVLHYQWMRNGAEIAGARGADFMIPSTRLADAGAYTVRVSNALGSVVSEPAMLTVNPAPTPPTIVHEPDNQTVGVGGTVVFAVQAKGTAPLTFIWRRNGLTLPGANGPLLVLTNVQKFQTGTYSVFVTNSRGYVNSRAATLTVTDAPTPPAIVSAPASLLRLEGESAEFHVTATGSAPLRYEWRRDGAVLPDAQTDTLTLAALKWTDAGVYTVTVSNDQGRVTSPPAILEVRSAQVGGTVICNNYSPSAGIDAPVFDSDGTNRVAGAAFLAQLYAGPDESHLAPVGGAVPFMTGMGAGYVDKGPGGNVVQIPSVEPGARAFVQMRAWESAKGGDFETALAAGGRCGRSLVIQVQTGGAGSPPSVPAELVGLQSFTLGVEAVPPVIAIVSPVAGPTVDERFALSGAVTDNGSVAGARWEWNGQDRGPLAPDAEGRFSVPGLRLLRGDNRLRVVATDAAGNESGAEVTATWTPARRLELPGFTEVREGRRAEVPIVFTNEGNLAGLSFALNFDPETLRDPQLVWADAVLAAGIVQVNTDTPGVVRATLSLPGASLPAGAQPLASASFRARSVPERMLARVTPVALDVADTAGSQLTFGTDTEAGTIAIDPRRLVGDNNGNDALDIGDATLIQRLITRLDPPRAWDIAGNDLNQSADLDSGDVIKVLRVVVGLDPAPVPPGLLRAGLQRSGRALAGTRRGTPSLAGVTAQPGLALATDFAGASPGGRITVRVRLQDLPAGTSGVAFRLQYPVAIFSVADAAACKVGSLVPAGVSALWNVDAAAGEIGFAASGTQAWSASEGVAAEVQLQVLPGATGKTWPLSVTAGQIAADNGYEVQTLAASSLELENLAPVLEPGLEFGAEGWQIGFTTEAGRTYEIEASTDLHTWSPVGTAVGTGQTLQYLDTDRAQYPARFYRLKLGL